MKIKFLIDQVENYFSRDNFKRLQDAIQAEPILKADFRFFQITVPAAVTRKDYLHHLNFMPTDVILTNVSDDESVTFHYDNFTRETIQFTATGACTFRAFIGRYSEGV